MRIGTVVAAAALIGVAACGKSSPSASDDLHRDLELARGQGLELAPKSGAQTIVSAAELVPQGSRSTSSHASRQRQKTPVAAAVPRGQTVVEAPQPAATPDPAPAPEATPVARPQPTTKPAVNPAPPGGYKSMGELIRKAPFPINP